MQKIDDVPSVELHRHLDGNIRPSTILDLARHNGLSLAGFSLEQIQDLVYVKDQTADLVSFLQKLDYGVSVLTSPDDCYRVAVENVEDLLNESIDYAELRFSPYYMSQTHHLPMQSVIEAVLSGVRDASLGKPIEIRLIGILSRTYGPELCFQELNALLEYSRDLVAIDLAGDEISFPAELFVSHFEKVRQAGLNVTVHAGEAAGPESVWKAIKLLGAKRIGHGVKAFQDKELMDYLRDYSIGIESCLTSNYQTATWTDTKKHPVKEFLHHGIQASLHTDDPGISNVTLEDEFTLAKRVLSFSDSDILKLKENAVAQAFDFTKK